MINLLLVNNFYPVMSHRRVQRKKEATNFLVTRYGPQSVTSASGLKIGKTKFKIILYNWGSIIEQTNCQTAPLNHRYFRLGRLSNFRVCIFDSNSVKRRTRQNDFNLVKCTKWNARRQEYQTKINDTYIMQITIIL